MKSILLLSPYFSRFYNWRLTNPPCTITHWSTLTLSPTNLTSSSFTLFNQPEKPDLLVIHFSRDLPTSNQIIWGNAASYFHLFVTTCFNWVWVLNQNLKNDSLTNFLGFYRSPQHLWVFWSWDISQLSTYNKTGHLHIDHLVIIIVTGFVIYKSTPYILSSVICTMTVQSISL